LEELAGTAPASASLPS